MSERYYPPRLHLGFTLMDPSTWSLSPSTWDLNPSTWSTTAWIGIAVIGGIFFLPGLMGRPRRGRR